MMAQRHYQMKFYKRVVRKAPFFHTPICNNFFSYGSVNQQIPTILILQKIFRHPTMASLCESYAISN